MPEIYQALADFVAEADKAEVSLFDLANSSISSLVQPLSTVMNAFDRLGDVIGQAVIVVGLASTFRSGKQNKPSRSTNVISRILSNRPWTYQIGKNVLW
jgi:hypothetical protein